VGTGEGGRRPGEGRGEEANPAERTKVRVSVNSIIINGLFDWQKTMHVFGAFLSAIPLKGRYNLLFFMRSLSPNDDQRSAPGASHRWLSIGLGANRLVPVRCTAWSCIPAQDAHESRGTDRTFRDQLSFVEDAKHPMGRWKLPGRLGALDSNHFIPISPNLSERSTLYLRPSA